MPRPLALPLPALLLPLALAGAALAVSPGPSTRQSLLPLGTCDGGVSAGKDCVDDFDCEDDAGSHACSTPLAGVAVRGVLTLIADKDAGGFDDTSFVPQAPDAQGTPIPADITKSALTVMLEFTRDGKDHALVETYKGLTDYSNPALGIECQGFCVPTWREPAVEARIASVGDAGAPGSGGGGGGGGGGGSGGGGGQQAGGSGIRIQWATGGAAMQKALLEALGLPEGSVAFLEAVTDTEIFDHSTTRDVLASVRRMKVTIRAVLPAEAP
jgi:uncharacterized membrane protein YgcG